MKVAFRDRCDCQVAIAAACLLATAVQPSFGRPAQEVARADDERRGSVAGQGPLFESSADLVVLQVGVLDSSGDPVSGLEVSDFVVVEDGVERPIAVFYRGDEVPLRISLLLDFSGSIEKYSTRAKVAAKEFLRTLSPEDCVYVLPFNGVVGPGRWGRGHDPELQGFIDRAVARGRTALYDALLHGLQNLAPGQRSSLRSIIRWQEILEGSQCHSGVSSESIGARPVLVVVSDGNDEGSAGTLADVIVEAWEGRVPILTVAIGAANPRAVRLRESMTHQGMDSRSLLPLSIRLEARLRAIADTTGGQLIDKVGWVDLGEAYRRVLTQLRSSYVLGFPPSHRTPGDADGEAPWRAVEVTMRDAQYVTLHPPGYFHESDTLRKAYPDLRAEIVAQFQETKISGALETIDELLRNDPANWQGRFLRARALALLNRTREALDEFKQVAGLQPAVPEVLEAVARLSKDLGDYDLAWEYSLRAHSAGGDMTELFAELSAMSAPPDDFKQRLDAPAVYVGRDGAPQLLVRQITRRAVDYMRSLVAQSPSMNVALQPNQADVSLVVRFEEIQVREQRTWSLETSRRKLKATMVVLDRISQSTTEEELVVTEHEDRESIYEGIRKGAERLEELIGHGSARPTC